MARNKTLKPLTEAPPEPESSSDHLSGSSTEPEEDPSSADEDDDVVHTPAVKTTVPPPLSPPSKKPTSKKPTTTPQPEPESESSESEQSDNEDEEDDDEEPEPEPEPPVAKLKPTSKPDPSSKSRSKPNNEKEKPPLKKIKKDNKGPGLSPRPGPGPGPSPGPGEEGSKKLFQRVFSEEDEVEILKGMIEFKERGGGDPMKNDEEYYGFVKKKLHAEVNKAQVNDKVKRLRKKFFNAKKNKKKIVNEHEKMLFGLSNRIWEVNNEDHEGDNNKVVNGGVTVAVSPIKEKMVDNVGGGKSGLKDRGSKGDNGVLEEKKKNKVEGSVEGIEGFEVGECEVKEGMRVEALKLMGEKGRDEIKEMWRKVEVAQLEVDLMRNEARVKENRMIMEALGLSKR